MKNLESARENLEAAELGCVTLGTNALLGVMKREL